MSDRAEQLAQAFEAANETVIAALEGCSEEQLRNICEGETWPAVVTAHHIALAYQPIAGLALVIANGQPVPNLSFEELDRRNAEHARECADVSREETVALLRQEARAAAGSVRGLSDEQLDRTAVLAFIGGATWSTVDMIQNALIGHTKDHGQSIQTALQGAPVSV